MKPPTLVHVKHVVLPLQANAVYIGVHSFGLPGTSVRITRWCNPFSLRDINQDDSIKAFEEWLDDRMDTDEYLRPLFGRMMLCDCQSERTCHGCILENVQSGCGMGWHGQQQ